MKEKILPILYHFKGDESVLDVGCGDPSVFVQWEAGQYPDINYRGLDLKRGQEWSCITPPNVDIIVANDLFPNVDQRLALFLEKYLPHCREMRLSLTYFDGPKWYQAKRLDGDEVLTVSAWTWAQIAHVLTGYPVIRKEQFKGIFANGRSVMLVWLKGGL